MKTYAVVLSAAALTLALTACGNNQAPAPAAPAASTAAPAAAAPAAGTAAAPAAKTAAAPAASTKK